ncbi:MAG: Hsp20/alpha crystallin family protein [Verrucomicrobia bacterium]|nr:Hsp20/alpha crystallin family protein [Verrucomicrobiota bacterium]MBS0645605.1 Hsp20/alpha crystallin family protein [Verrucomicrobiota bacterium]
MDLIPKWFSNVPRQSRKPSDFFNLGKFFDDFEWSLNPIGLSSSGLSVSSDEKFVVIEAHVPGLSAKDVEVSIDRDGVLWIKGSKQEEEKDKKRKFYRHAQTSFSYCVPLWDEIDIKKEPKATCKDGIMRLTFEKRKDGQEEARKIHVEGE